MCACNAADRHPTVQTDLFSAACRDWNVVASEFQKALSQYVHAIDRHKNE
jgi:hypothetical protein